MKTRILLFWALTISTVVYSQLKVDNLGHIGMGTNYPNSGYRLHIKGDVLLTNYPEVPWYEFQLKVGQKDGAVIGCTSGIIDFYTSNTGYNKLIAKQYKTHATWDKGHQPLEKGLSIILALNPYYNIITEVHDKVEKEQYGIEPAELFSLTPGIIDVNEDGYAIDYNQLIPILVGAIKEQQKQIELLWTLASHPDKTTLDTLLFNDQNCFYYGSNAVKERNEDINNRLCNEHYKPCSLIHYPFNKTIGENCRHQAEQGKPDYNL